jgi:hypothetical protein
VNPVCLSFVLQYAVCLILLSLILVNYIDRGTLLVAQLVEALRYKPENRGFDS